MDFNERLPHVREFRVQDDDGRALTLAGWLPLRAGGGEGLDLELRANGFEIIENPDADIELDGALRVTGDVRTTRGTYEFQGREFSLERGRTIRFVGTDDINPLLDVTASRTVSAVDARVHIGGTLDAPTLSLSSSPPLEQADILSLIVFNRPVNELGAGEQVALTRRATAMAAGIVASEITSALDDVLGVDLLDIEAGFANGVFAPAVTIGQQFGDLFVEVRQQFGPANPSEFVIEYRINDWFRIESAIVDREGMSGPLLRRCEGTGIDAVFSFRR